MCTTKYFKSRNCEHKWLVIDTPCGYGKGFTTCKDFKGGSRATAAALPKREKASREDCPWHGLKGRYDFNYTRMVEETKHSFSLPTDGPLPPGTKMICCVVM